VKDPRVVSLNKTAFHRSWLKYGVLDFTIQILSSNRRLGRAGFKLIKCDVGNCNAAEVFVGDGAD